MAITLSNLNRFTKFFTGRFLGTFAVKWLLSENSMNMLPHYLVKHWCESEKKDLNSVNVAKSQARRWLSRALSSSFSSVVARRTKRMRQPLVLVKNRVTDKCYVKWHRQRETYDDGLKEKKKIFVKMKQRTRRRLGAFPRVPLQCLGMLGPDALNSRLYTDTHVAFKLRCD